MANRVPVPGDIGGYLDLVTSEHNQQPKYMAMLQAVLQPYCDNIALLGTFHLLFDLDLAVGDQQDILGEWIGRDRNLVLPLTDFFSLDTVGLGLDEAIWYEPNIGATVLSLPDDLYRLLLKAFVIANHWDGSIEQAYEAWDLMLSWQVDFKVLIQDTERLSMYVALVGPSAPGQLVSAFFEYSGLRLKPSGATLNHVLPTVYPAGVGGTPYFALDVENETCAGLDVGAWGNFISQE